MKLTEKQKGILMMLPLVLIYIYSVYLEPEIIKFMLTGIILILIIFSGIIGLSKVIS